MPQKTAVGHALSTIILQTTYNVQSNTTLATLHVHTVPKPARTRLACVLSDRRIHMFWRPYQASRKVNGALGDHTMTSHHHSASPGPPGPTCRFLTPLPCSAMTLVASKFAFRNSTLYRAMPHKRAFSHDISGHNTSIMYIDYTTMLESHTIPIL